MAIAGCILLYLNLLSTPRIQFVLPPYFAFIRTTLERYIDTVYIHSIHCKGLYRHRLRHLCKYVKMCGDCHCYIVYARVVIYLPTEKKGLNESHY